MNLIGSIPFEVSCGIKTDLPADLYHLLNAASSHRLGAMLKSPAHCREMIDRPPEDTESRILGAATHLCVLQPKLFEDTYVIAEQCSDTKKSGERCRNPGKVRVEGKWKCGVHVKSDRFAAVFKAVHEKMLANGAMLDHISENNSHYYRMNGRTFRVSDHDMSRASARRLARENGESIRVDITPYGSDDPRKIITREAMDTCMTMLEAVRDHPAASALLRAKGPCEVSGIFRHECGQLCKVRPDKIGETRGAVAMSDVKTTIDASKDAFERAIFDYGYYRQGALYVRGMRELGVNVEAFFIIAVEKQPPYAVQVYRVHEDALDLGWKELQPLIKRYYECDQSGEWPAYSDQIQDITLSSWQQRKIKLRTETV